MVLNEWFGMDGFKMDWFRIGIGLRCRMGRGWVWVPMLTPAPANITTLIACTHGMGYELVHLLAAVLMT